ncbi:hypothetical protein JV33_20430 [Pectobacterium carotovorum subsp. carotovorum]|nr:hypothetical protein JV33_20430 [Pectobacterium carotovorum subsp. carotovorum]KML68495.1 hypothetical protein G032_15155 [Pectobacterium carotovorum subsp. carotovorum ICMP 5702]
MIGATECQSQDFYLSAPEYSGRKSGIRQDMPLSRKMAGTKNTPKLILFLIHKSRSIAVFAVVRRKNYAEAVAGFG